MDTDISHFSTTIQALCSTGIVLTTLAEERDRNPKCLQKLHCLRVEVDADIPADVPYPELGFDDFVREVNSPTVLDEGFFIAKKGHEYIGLSCLNRNPVASDALNQSITGVARSWRHRGVALALKVRGVEYAKVNGYRSITTYVDSTNMPMSSLNRKVGFRPGIAAVLMELCSQE